MIRVVREGDGRGAEGMARMSRAEAPAVVQARLGSTHLPGKVLALYPADPAFGLYDVFDLMDRRPRIAAINAKYAGVNWYRHHLNRLRTIDPGATRTAGSR